MDRPATSDLGRGRVIEHHGVKGMHWGVRKKQQDREPASSDSTRAKELVGRARVSSRDALSNKELQDAITRLNLEQQFDRLKPLTNGEKVKKWLADTLISLSKETATNTARSFAADQAKAAVKKVS